MPIKKVNFLYYLDREVSIIETVNDCVEKSRKESNCIYFD